MAIAKIPHTRHQIVESISTLKTNFNGVYFSNITLFFNMFSCFYEVVRYLNCMVCKTKKRFSLLTQDFSINLHFKCSKHFFLKQYYRLLLENERILEQSRW